MPERRHDLHDPAAVGGTPLSSAPPGRSPGDRLASGHGPYRVLRVGDVRLTTASADAVLSASRTALSARPAGMIYDLTGLQSSDGVSQLCMTLADDALLWPGTPAALLAGIDVARQLVADGVGQRLPIAHSADACGDALRADTNWRRAELTLPPSLDAPRQTRRFIEDRISRWRLSVLNDTATLVASELATNAVTHARTFLDIHLTCHDQFLAIAVADRSDSQVALRRPRSDDETGRGLLLVAAMAYRWGQTASPEAGKTVWAVVNTKE